MHLVDVKTWSRRQHYNFFKSWDHPHFSMCANVDVTAFYPLVKQRGQSLTIAIIYLITRAANEIIEFRYRVHNGDVVEYEVVHPGFTILVDEENFSFCTVEYIEDFNVFHALAVQQIADVRKNPWVSKTDSDDFFYMTAIPWVTFTSFKHPMNLDPADSIPRFAWGKIFQDSKRMKMPLDVQGHHALMDGFHLGRFYEKMKSYLDQPDTILCEG